MSFAISVAYSQILNVPTFDLNVSDTASVISDNFSSLNSNAQVKSVAATDSNIPLSVAKFSSNPYAVIKTTTPLDISDSQTAILGSISALNASAPKINTIVPSTKVSVSYSQYTLYKNAFSICSNLLITDVPCLYIQPVMAATTATITVSDTNSNIVNYASTLSTFSSRIETTTNTSIQVISEFLNNNFSTAGNYRISDYGNTITANIISLRTHVSNIISITATSEMSLPYATWSSCASVVSLISPANYITVTDVSCNNLSALSGTITIKDTAANITQNLAAITTFFSNKNNAITSISVSDNVAVTVNSTIYAANSAVMILLKFTGSVTYVVTDLPCYMLSSAVGNIKATSPYNGKLRLLDTIGNLQAYKQTIRVNSTYIDTATATSQVVINSNTIDQTNATLISKLTNCTITSTVNFFASNFTVSYPLALFNISDSSNNVSPSSLYTNNARISSVTVTTGTTVGAYTYSAANAVTYSAFLLKLPNQYVNVSDTAAAILSNYTALNSIAATIAKVQFTGTLTLTLAQRMNALGALIASNFTVTSVDCASLPSVLSNAYVTGVTIVDTVANIEANFDYVASKSSKITSVTTTGVLTLTCAQFYNNSAFVLNFSNVTIKLVDTSANFNLNAISNGVLQTASVFSTIVTNYSKINSILCKDTLILNYTLQYSPTAIKTNVIPLIKSGYQLVDAPLGSVATLLQVKSGNYCISIKSKDSTDINLALQTSINYVNQIESINCTYAGLVGFTYSQYATLLNKFTSKVVNVNAKMSEINSAISNAGVSKITVSDTADNFMKNYTIFDSIDYTFIYSVSITNLNFSISMDQYVTSKTALDKIYSSAWININPVTSSTSYDLKTAISKLNTSLIKTIVVLDTSAQINDAFNVLLAFDKTYNYAKITRISAVDTLYIPMSTITAQKAIDKSAKTTYFTYFLSKITSFVAGDATFSAVTTGAVTSTSTVQIKDSAANIATYFNKFIDYPNAYTSIKLTVSPSSMTITATQASSVPTVVGMIANAGCTVTVSGVPCGSIASLASVAQVLQVVDTSSAVAAYLTAISTYASKISSVTVSGTTLAAPITLTRSQYTTTAFTASYIKLTSVPFTSAASMLAISAVKTIEIEDYVSNFNLSFLSNANVTKITFLDSGTIQMTASTFTTNYQAYTSKLPEKCIQITSGSLTSATILSKQAYFSPLSVLTATGVACSDVSSIAATGATMTISDSSTAITTSITLLETNVDKITSISASSGTISLTSACINYAIVPLLQSSFTVSDAVTCSQYLTIANTNLSSVSITDEPTSIIGNFSSLASAKILSITSASDITLTYSQATSALADKIAQFKVEGATCLQANSLLTKGNVAGLNVVDSSANVISNISLLANPKILSATPLTALQLTAPLVSTNLSAIAKMPTNSITVSDTASNISQFIDVLQSCDTQIQTVIFS